jgi:hypothetical protein
MIDKSIRFPIKVTFENGEIEYYQDIEDVELNLEDFDSDLNPECVVEDSSGKKLDLDVSMLELRQLSFSKAEGK